MIHLAKKGQLYKVFHMQPPEKYLYSGNWSFDDSLFKVQLITSIFEVPKETNIFKRIRNYWCGHN